MINNITKHPLNAVGYVGCCGLKLSAEESVLTANLASQYGVVLLDAVQCEIMCLIVNFWLTGLFKELKVRHCNPYITHNLGDLAAKCEKRSLPYWVYSERFQTPMMQDCCGAYQMLSSFHYPFPRMSMTVYLGSICCTGFSDNL